MGRTITIGRLEQGGLLAFPFDQLRNKHFAIEGRIDQRKTLLLVSILSQYVRLPAHAVVFIDLGGDQAAFWILKEEAEKAGKPFYFFSLGAHDGASWDPIGNTPAFSDDLTVAAAGVSQGLRLEFGEGYGRTFWARLSTRDINQAFDNLRATGVVLPSFVQLAEELKRMAAASRSREHTSEAYLAAEQLLRYRALTEKRPTELFLGKAIEEGAVVVFYVPAGKHGGAARAVASLAGWCTTVEAAYRFEKGREERFIHLAIDEFPQVAAAKSSVDATMAMARKWNVMMYPVFQDREQLKTADGDLSSLIKSQCQRFIFTAESLDAQNELRYESKDVIRTLDGKNYSSQHLSASTSVRDYWDPELTRNEILEINGVAMKALAVLKLGDKHRNPIPFTVIPPRSKAKHRELNNTPLPPLPADTLARRTPSTRRPRRTVDPKRPDRIARFQSVWERIRAEQIWRMK